MAEAITKKELAHLAELSRLELKKEEEEKLIKDLGNILGHFEELKGLAMENTEPQSGGSDLKNAFREDEAHTNTDQGKGIERFPKTKDGFLVIPPVFE